MDPLATILYDALRARFIQLQRLDELCELVDILVHEVTAELSLQGQAVHDCISKQWLCCNSVGALGQVLVHILDCSNASYNVHIEVALVSPQEVRAMRYHPAVVQPSLVTLPAIVGPAHSASAPCNFGDALQIHVHR